MAKFDNKRKIALGFIGILSLTPLFLLSACSSQPPSQTSFTSTIDGKNYKYVGGRLSLVDAAGDFIDPPIHDKAKPQEYYSYLFSSILSAPLLTFVDQYASYQATQPSIVNGNPSQYVYRRASENFAIFSNPLNSGSNSIALKMSNINFAYVGIDGIKPEKTTAPKPDPEEDTSFPVSMSISGNVEFGFWTTYNKATQDELTNSNFAQVWAPFTSTLVPSSSTPVNLSMPFSITSKINIVNKLTSPSKDVFQYTGEASLATQNEKPAFDTTTQKYFDLLLGVINARRFSAQAFNDAVKLLP